jgi:hypothetical protein
MERKRESIDIKVSKNDVKLKIKKEKKNNSSKYFWKLLLFFLNSNRKWSKETQTIRILLVRYNC